MNDVTDYWFLIRYGIVGICGGLVQTATLYIWVEALHLEAYYIVGAAVGFCLALAVTFTLQKYWTFEDYVQEHVRRQFIFYTVIALINLGLNILLLHLSKLALETLGFNFFDVWYLIVQVTIIAALSLLSFVSNYFITFHKKI
jgi:putative flippase GtrA